MILVAANGIPSCQPALRCSAGPAMASGHGLR
jgi:hypothetical protein